MSYHHVWTLIRFWWWPFAIPCRQELVMIWTDTQFNIKFENEFFIPLTMNHNIIMSSPQKLKQKNGELACHHMPYF